MRVRELPIEELDRLEPLGAAFWEEQRHPGEYDWEHIKSQLAAVDDAGCLGNFVVEGGEGGVLHGVITGFIHPYLMTGETVLTELWWFVDEAARNAGFGVSLLSEFMEWGARRGARNVRMVTLETLPQAERLMAQIGFKKLETHWIKGL
jgi:RimJ/RimL family protein N-acetyltransferase